MWSSKENWERSGYVGLIVFCYADNILLVAPSVTSLQELLHLCEQELDW